MTKPDALALADALEADRPVCGPDAKQAAAELRRLHAEVERLSAPLAATPAPAPQIEAKPIEVEKIDAAGAISWDGPGFAATFDRHKFARLVESACADAWGVKLVGQGKEASNAE